MPKSWYIYSENKINDDDSLEEIAHKQLYQRICAHKKPFFFKFNYQHTGKEYDDYIANINSKSYSMFQVSFNELRAKQNKTEQEQRFVQWAEDKMPLDMSKSVMNRIAWRICDEFDGIKQPHKEKFNPSMIKSGIEYSKNTYKDVEKLYKQYKNSMSEFAKRRKLEQYFDEEDKDFDDIDQIRAVFEEKCVEICPNEQELCDILVDMCYKGRASKEIAWNICGETIIENLLKNNNYNLYYPEKVIENAEFECCGSKFVMKKLKIGGDVE